MGTSDLFVYALVGLALVFDFVNGFHDAANSIATVVSTRVLSPRWAVAWAAFFNFIAFLLFSLKVATTIAKGVVDPHAVTLTVVAGGLTGAIVWNLITWYGGIPSSSSHALVGGVAGAALAHGGPQVLIAAGIWKVLVFILVAPVLGMVLGFALMVLTYRVFQRSVPARISSLFRRLQLASAAAYSLGHGGNDAQKTMGIIMMVLIASGSAGIKDPVPLWVVLSCHLAIALGTMAGGWRIVRTMGHKICRLQPVHGFSAETAGALTLYGASAFGIPVSTTHVITGSILGVGMTRGIRAVKWGTAGRVVWAWILTIPMSGFIAAGTFYLLRLLGL